MLDKNCLRLEENFDPEFLKSFRNLPPTIREPWNSNAWKAYDVLLRFHSSHAVTSTLLGSSINQMVFAETVDHYSEREFKVKSCLSLARTTDISKLGVSVCSVIDKSEISKVFNLDICDYLDIRGGFTETRNELIKRRRLDWKIHEWSKSQQVCSSVPADSTMGDAARSFCWKRFGSFCQSRPSTEGISIMVPTMSQTGHKTYRSSILPRVPLPPHHSMSVRWLQRAATAMRTATGGQWHGVPVEVRTVFGTETWNLFIPVKRKRQRKSTWRLSGTGVGVGCHSSRDTCYCSSPSKKRTTVWKIENKHALFLAHFVSLNQNISKGKDEL